MNKMWSGLTAVVFCLFASVGSAHAENQPAGTDAYPGEDVLDRLTTPHLEAGGMWELSVGSDYSSGKYGASRATQVVSVPFGLSYRSGRWRITADSSWLRVTGPVDYASILDLTQDEVDDLGLGNDETAVSGMADTFIGATYGLVEDFERGIFVDVGARAKIPTATRSKGLGNGKFAGDLQVDVIKLVGRWSFLVSGSYGFRHHTRGNRDTLSLSGGIGRVLSDRVSAGAIYEWRKSSFTHGRNAQTAIVYLSTEISDHVTATFYGVRGLTSAGVDIQGGLRVAYRWP